jgi:cobalamin biosynthesis protein CbiG
VVLLGKSKRPGAVRYRRLNRLIVEAAANQTLNIIDDAAGIIPTVVIDRTTERPLFPLRPSNRIWMPLHKGGNAGVAVALASKFDVTVCRDKADRGVSRPDVDTISSHQYNVNLSILNRFARIVKRV